MGRETLRIFAILSALATQVPAQTSASSYTLVTEPDQGLARIYDLIVSAKSTLDVTMYELSDARAEQLLAQAAATGVKVRVILDQNLEQANNTAAYNYLASRGVQVRWANPKYSATHQKTITVDGATAAIMTLNLTSRYYAADRDFAVIENDPADVAAIEATFEADFSDSAMAPPNADDLAWSPTNSRPVILSMINSARQSLLVENEEMSDREVVDALASVAGRGVQVQVTMTNTGDEYSAEFNQLAAAGAHIATYASNAALYIHAKVILADYGAPGAQVFLGSENFSSASLTRNRELGLTISDPAILQSIYATLTGDFNGGTPWPASKASLSVVNAASLQPGLASGGWVTIFGTNLSPITDDWTSSIIDGRLPESLDGVSVAIGGNLAYLAYISPSQINALSPDLSPGTAPVVVHTPSGDTQAMIVAQTVQPAFFQWGNYAVATRTDFSYATKNGTFAQATVPAAPGEVIILWGAGFGPTNPVAPVGVESPSGSVYRTANPVSVTLGSTPAVVYGAALAPGFAGLYQVAIQIPRSLSDGDYPLIATVSGVQSPASVLLTVAK